MLCKVSDFGLSRELAEDSPVYETQVHLRCPVPHFRNILKGNGYNLSAQRFQGSFVWTSVTHDWLIVTLRTMDQYLRVVHLTNPKNHCTQSLYPFPLEF